MTDTLPTTTAIFPQLIWHDAFKTSLPSESHTRNQIVDTLLRTLEGVRSYTDIFNGGLFVFAYEHPAFKLLATMDEDDHDRLHIKRVVAYDEVLGPMDIHEAEQLFLTDLSQFYKDGFINSYYGTALIEESYDRSYLEVHLDTRLVYFYEGAKRWLTKNLVTSYQSRIKA